ncbi:MAG TPA: septum formation initiator family protein [Candidatus Lachnoclostridium pullistercoris]|uniref:Septum formation initiator family protein n=1 Tax=Candidatus Lachnoclostridium pullistercoris TaxID=2838632 RepID=A0A9D2PEP5_9FIRM|nr:septum formation initiator family protein [Candidatus Lachnoclostridium pullistercoris]
MAAGRAPHRMAAYVDGNTVRRAEPEVRRERRERPRRQESTPYLKEQIRRNQERALSMDLPYVMMLSAAAVCALVICVGYLHQQSAMQARLDHIETLEQQVENQRAENDTLETRINTSVNLDYIYKVATEELGMVYAGKDQVLLYDQTESEYIRQNEDIPNYN